MIEGWGVNQPGIFQELFVILLAGLWYDGGDPEREEARDVSKAQHREASCVIIYGGYYRRDKASLQRWFYKVNYGEKNRPLESCWVFP